MKERLKRINSTLLELETGILFWGLLCQAVGMCFVQNRFMYTASLWVGIALAFVSAWHMYKSLDRALKPGVDAAKAVTVSNLVRYICIIIIFAVLLLTKFFQPLVAFLGLMSLKVAAYLQPITHKIYNKLWR